jgi:ketosteroid isomerase-like protein
MSKVSPEQENIRIVYSAFDRGDIPAVIDKLAEDVDWSINSREVLQTGATMKESLTPV